MTIPSLRHLLSHVAATAALTASPGAADATDAEVRESDVDVGADAEGDFATADAGQALAAALAELPPLEATHVACVLALSTERDRRLALACALEWTFRLVGDDIVIDHLASDDDARVRRAAARAAWIRRAAGGDPGVLARLADDPDPGVREVVALAAAHR